MRPSRTLVVLTCLIAALALIAAGAGLLVQGQGAPYDFTSIRGEVVRIQGQGLYRYDPELSAVQAIPQDAVTLAAGIPLLLIGLWLYARGRLRGQLLLTGTLAYFLYTYTGMAFGIAFNPLFLVYLALFSLSLFAFIIAMRTPPQRAPPLLRHAVIALAGIRAPAAGTLGPVCRTRIAFSDIGLASW